MEISFRHFEQFKKGAIGNIDGTGFNSPQLTIVTCALHKGSTAFLDLRKVFGCLDHHSYPFVSGTELLWLHYNFSY